MLLITIDWRYLVCTHSNIDVLFVTWYYCVKKILNGLLDTEIANVLTAAENSKTRGHSMKLIKYDCSIDATKYYFSNHIVHIWNSLPNDIVSASSVSSFKKHFAEV